MRWVNALSHLLGVRHVEMPATPERLWQTIRAGEGWARAVAALVKCTFQM